MRTSAVLLCLAALFVLPRSAHAAESYANCTNTITSLPVTISTPGNWCMKQNLSTAVATGYIIDITASSVTLDCNDFLLTGTAGAAATTVGIYAHPGTDIAIRHCNIQGFRTGVNLSIGAEALVEDNTFNGNWWIGIRVQGDGSIVRRNQVFNTGGSTNEAGAYGVYALQSVNVSDNTVAGVNARVGGKGNAWGIYTHQNAYGVIEGNRVRGLAKDGGGKDYGILNTSAGRISMQKNDVYGDGSAGSIGLSCVDATGIAKENIIAGFATGIQTCTDAGGNDVSP